MHLIRTAIYVAIIISAVNVFADESRQSEARDLWGSFANQHYVDREVGKKSRYPSRFAGREIKIGQRAPGSLVVSDKVILSATAVTVIKAAFSGKKLPKGITIPPKDYTAWRTKDGALLVTFCASQPSEGGGTYQIWDDATGKLVEVPALRHFVEATLWVKTNQAVVIQEAIKFDADVEIYG